MSEARTVKLTLPILYPLFILFIVLLIFSFYSNTIFSKTSIHPNSLILHASNIFWLVLTLLTMKSQTNALNNNNPNVFIRAVMSGMLLKMLAGALTLLFYYFISQADFDEKSVVISLIFYLAYLSLEVNTMMKMNRSKNG